MALDITGNIFNQRDVRERLDTIRNAINLSKVSAFQASTTNASYIDVTGATITLTGLDANKTYTIIGIIAGRQSNVSTSVNGAQIVIESTNLQQVFCSTQSSPQIRNMTLISLLKAQTGNTSYTVKLQHKRTAGTLTTIGNIIIIAIEE